jgi:hypothetical protein
MVVALGALTVVAYVDNAGIPHRGTPRHHMTADSLAELHAFAASIGVARCWFHRGARIPHYDVNDEQRAAAITAGARPLDSRALVRAARATR